jgi:hypothetical protein
VKREISLFVIQSLSPSLSSLASVSLQPLSLSLSLSLSLQRLFLLHFSPRRLYLAHLSCSLDLSCSLTLSLPSLSLSSPLSLSIFLSNSRALCLSGDSPSQRFLSVSVPNRGVFLTSGRALYRVRVWYSHPRPALSRRLYPNKRVGFDAIFPISDNIRALGGNLLTFRAFSVPRIPPLIAQTRINGRGRCQIEKRQNEAAGKRDAEWYWNAGKSCIISRGFR